MVVLGRSGKNKKGKGTAEEYIRNYKKYILEKPMR
jgi:hypothetical protein